jgi:hypothetical protein
MATGAHMRHIRYGFLVLAALLTAASGLRAQQADAEASPLEVRVWLDRGDEPVLRRGDRVRVYYRSSEDAWIAIFHIDTDGVVRLLLPRSPREPHRAEAGRDYRLLFPRSSYWQVDEYEGKGYFFAVASPIPFDLSAVRWIASEKTWDLGLVGRTVYEDPYLAMDDYVAALLPEWETVRYGLDFLSYDVGSTHAYPRFLCYDCHGFRSYASWNPYTYACTSFRVVIWEDPYFYPAYRYGPTRVVFATPPRGRARFEFRERAPGEGWSPLRVTRQPSTRRPVEYLEPSVAGPGRGAAPPARRGVRPGDDAPGRGGGEGAVRPPLRRGNRPDVPSAAPSRRPSDPAARRPTSRRPAAPGVRAPESSGARPGAPPARGEGSSQERPTLQRRPASPAGGARPPSVRPAPGGEERPGGGTRILRPSERVRPGADPPATRPARPGSGGTGAVRPPPSPRPSADPSPRPGARPAPQRPGARPSGGSSARPPPERPRVRPAPSRPGARPPRPPGGSSARPGSGRPDARPAPSRPSARPTPSTPRARPAPSRPPAKPRRPPPRRPGGGRG